MKHIKLIICTLLIFCMSVAGFAEAKSRGGSFKSGFSSQKRNTAKPATTYNTPAPEQKKTSFGSFGTADAKNRQAAINIPPSQMSKDLTNTTAQSNALKAVDERNKLKASAIESESGWFRSGNQNTAAQNRTSGQAKSQSVQNAERNTSQPQNNGGQSNGFLHGLMWFMVGNSLAQHVTANVPSVAHVQASSHDVNREKDQGGQENINGENNSINANGIAAQREQDVPAEETEPLFMKFIRVLLWLVIVSGIVFGVRRFRNARDRNLKKTVNYSLGS